MEAEMLQWKTVPVLCYPFYHLTSTLFQQKILGPQSGKLLLFRTCYHRAGQPVGVHELYKMVVCPFLFNMLTK